MSRTLMIFMLMLAVSAQFNSFNFHSDDYDDDEEAHFMRNLKSKRDFCGEEEMARINPEWKKNKTRLNEELEKQKSINSTFTKPCNDNGVCENFRETWRCRCFTGKTGENCEKNAPNYQICNRNFYNYPKCDVECEERHGYYTCDEKGQRKCLPNRYGSECELENLCLKKSQAAPFSADQSPCIPTAECVPTENERGYVCLCNQTNILNCYSPILAITNNSCPLHHYGANCTQFCKPKPGFYVCDWQGDRVCLDDKIGPLCENPNFCTKFQPCIAGADCRLSQDLTSFSCYCNDTSNNYTNCYRAHQPCPDALSDKGPHNLCYNQGKCMVDLHNAIYCSCPHNYTGKFCQIQRSFCIEEIYRQKEGKNITDLNSFYSFEDENVLFWEEQDLCHKNGVCVNLMQNSSWQCICFHGYQGKFCQQTVSNNGTRNTIFLLIFAQLNIILLFIVWKTGKLAGMMRMIRAR